MNSLQRFSTRRSKILFWVGFVLLIILAAVCSIGMGSVKLSPGQVFEVLCGRDMSSTAAKIVLYYYNEDFVSSFK